MSSPQNIWTNPLAFGGVLPLQQLYETRMENDSSGKVLYVGFCLVPNGDTSLAIWLIFKMGYDGNGFIDRVQKPDDDIAFRYVWDDRATYFA